MTLDNSYIKHVHQAVRSLEDEIIELRHTLHSIPELRYEEKDTAATIVQTLSSVPGLRVRSGIGQTGVVALLNEEKAGPCIALRCDMDALPLNEENETIAYRSTRPGCMHACGHDGHMAMMVGAVRVLASLADELPGKIKFIFQPAEEGGAGAEKMIEDGVLENPKVDAIFGMHGWPDIQLGTIGFRPGPFMAGMCRFDCTIRGEGTHAAMPHLGSDVIAAAGSFLQMIQTVRARRVDPLKPLVISVCAIEGGSAYNILPPQCTMKGTIRSLDPDVDSFAREQVVCLAEQVAEAFNARAEVTFQDISYPPVINHAEGCQRLLAAAEQLDEIDSAISDYPPSMGAEDFSYYQQHVPGVHYFLGLSEENRTNYPLHHPGFDFNDRAIRLGMSMHALIAKIALETPPETT